MLLKPFCSYKCFNMAATATDRCLPWESTHTTVTLSWCFHSSSTFLRKYGRSFLHSVLFVTLPMSPVCSPQCSNFLLLRFANVQHFITMSNFSSGHHFASKRRCRSGYTAPNKFFILTPLSTLGGRSFPHPQTDPTTLVHWCEV